MGKLVYDKRNGYSYVSDNGIKYNLLEGMSYQGNSTSDILFIMLDYGNNLSDLVDANDFLVGWFYGVGDCVDENFISRYVNLYETKHPEIVNCFKKKKCITKPMPAELHDMLKKLEEISQYGGIRTYYDKTVRMLADGRLDEYEYSDSTLVYNLLCCCEEVAAALLDEDIDKAEKLIKIYAKELMED